MTTARIRTFTALALGLSLAAAGAAQAANFSRAVYAGAKDDIQAAYKAEREACDSLAGNAKDVCVEIAKGHEKVALKRLAFDHSGRAEDELDWMTAVYEARYDVAREHCDDLAGDAKDLCVREAKTARDKAKADVKLAGKLHAAIGDAEQARLKADHKLAKARCDALAGDAKDVCEASVKARYPSM